MLKKLLATSLMAVAMLGQAQAQNISFVDGEATFAKTVTARGSNTYTFTFDGLVTGIYDVVGSFSGYNFNVTGATFNGSVLDTANLGNFSFGSITYNGTSPFVLSITGTRVNNNAAGFSGSLAVSPVPEPESIAMMLAGLGVIGAVVRRRNRAAQPAAAAA